jgi:hypothetical protein
MQLNRKHFAEFFRADYKTVSVTFSTTKSHYGSYGKKYTYKVPKALDVKPGDLLVVYVAGRDQAEALQIVTIAEVHENPAINAGAHFDYKWAVGRFQDVMAEFNSNKARDEKLRVAVDKLERALGQVSLRKQIAEAMGVLDDVTVAELKEAFGADFASIEPPTG